MICKKLMRKKDERKKHKREKERRKRDGSESLSRGGLASATLLLSHNFSHTNRLWCKCFSHILEHLKHKEGRRKRSPRKTGRREDGIQVVVRVIRVLTSTVAVHKYSPRTLDLKLFGAPQNKHKGVFLQYEHISKMTRVKCLRLYSSQRAPLVRPSLIEILASFPLYQQSNRIARRSEDTKVV